MTAYASHVFSSESINGRLEIKSVNSKSLDLKIRIHEALGEIEYEISSWVRKKIQRGKVFIRIDLDFPPELSIYKLKESTLLSYIKFIDKIENSFDGLVKPSSVDILKLPDVMKCETNEEITQKIKSAIFPQLEILIEKFNKVRTAEGDELKKFFFESIDLLEQNKIKIESFIEGQKSKIRTRLEEKFKELREISDYNSNRMEEELLYYSERLDITEEIVRINSHIKMLKKEFNIEKNGKKIDFIFQEVNRETNTIASKSQDFEIVNCTISMKDIISQMREQIANIE